MTKHVRDVLPFEAVNDDDDANGRNFWDHCFTDWQDLDPAKLEARRWVYANHYLEGAVSATIADGGVGKSTHALTEAIAIVTGRPLLGITPTKHIFPDGAVRDRRSVLYYNAEESLGEIKRRVLAICQHYDIDPKELNYQGSRKPWRPIGRLSIVSGHDCPLVLAKNNGDGFALTDDVEYLEGFEGDVIILDPFVSLHECPENDNSMIDAIVKRLGRATTADGLRSIELVHHARKPAQGGTIEVGAADARGASALSDGVRSLRMLNRMTASEALQAKVDNARNYFRVDSGKGNYTASQAASLWYRHQSVVLPNGDDVGIIVPWKMPGAFDGVTAAHMHAVRALARDGEYRADYRSPEWIGAAVAEVLDIEAEGDRKRIRTILKTWYEKAALKKVERTDAARHTRLYVEPGEWAEP